MSKSYRTVVLFFTSVTDYSGGFRQCLKYCHGLAKFNKQGVLVKAHLDAVSYAVVDQALTDYRSLVWKPISLLDLLNVLVEGRWNGIEVSTLVAAFQRDVLFFVLAKATLQKVYFNQSEGRFAGKGVLPCIKLMLWRIVTVIFSSCVCSVSRSACSNVFWRLPTRMGDIEVENTISDEEDSRLSMVRKIDACDSEKKFEVSCIGRICEEKRQVEFLQYLSKEYLRIPDSIAIQFYGGGSGLYFGEFENLINSALGCRVKYGGVCNDLATLYNDTDCVIITSRREGFPLVFVEALAAKRYVVMMNCFEFAFVECFPNVVIVESYSALVKAVIKISQMTRREMRREVEEGYSMFKRYLREPVLMRRFAGCLLP